MATYPITIVGIDDKCIFDRSELLFWKEEEDDWGWRCPVCLAEPLEQSADAHGHDIFLWECSDVQEVPALRPDVLLLNSGLWARKWREEHLG